MIFVGFAMGLAVVFLLGDIAIRLRAIEHALTVLTIKTITPELFEQIEVEERGEDDAL